jgi:anti-sigma-K factor RskA
MTAEHDNWLERGDIYALGALDGPELKEFEAHLASGCAVCEAYVRDTRETLRLLHRTLAPLAPSTAVKKRILDQIAADKVVPLPAKRQSSWRQVSAGALAAGIIAAVLTGVLYHNRYEPRHTIYTSVIDLLRDPATRDYPLYGTGPTPAARGRFLWNESGEGHIFVTNLPAAPEGKMYAVWTIPDRSPPRYVGAIKTDATGQGGLHINTSAGHGAVHAFAVSLEPAGTPAAPTGPIVLASAK